jgi:Ca-activated chloride channel family protein
MALLGYGMAGGDVCGCQAGGVDTAVARHSPVRATINSSAIRLDVRLVLVPVTVTDPYERLVQGLNKEDFRLFDDGVEQEITQFYTDDSPISVAIVFDASGSMARKMDISRQAIAMFLSRCIPGDEFLLIRFSDHPQELQAFTKDPSAIEEVAAKLKPYGWTALYDAIHLGISDMKRAQYEKKVLLVLSDGADNNSRYTEREIRGIVQESDVRLFAISIFDRSPTLQKLADNSGGRAYRIRNLQELPELASRISDELHSEYVLGYTPPPHPPDGKYRKLRVEMVRKPDSAPMRASWRPGYYGPSR